MSKVFELGDFASPGKSNTRKTGGSVGQSFQLKYREDTFTIANKVFDDLGLADHSLKMLIAKPGSGSTTVLLTVVDDESGDMMRRTAKTGLTKGRTFKSSILEDALVAGSLIVKGLKGANQMLNLEQGLAGETVVYEITKGETTTSPNPTGTIVGTSNAPASEDLLNSPDQQEETEQQGNVDRF